MLKNLSTAVWYAAVLLLPAPAAAQCILLPPGDARQQFEFDLPADTLTPRIPDDAHIGDIEIRRMNVFDLDNPRDDVWYGRLANRFHWITRERVVRDMLLFSEGDAWQPQDAAESERLLRGQNYIYDARVRPLRLCGKRVDMLVLVRDVWTLSGGLSLSRSGGDNSSEIFISDSNLLGTGTTLSLGREDDDERSGDFIAFSDDTLLGTRWQLATRYADNDDGANYTFSLLRPFYSLDSRSSKGMVFQRKEQESALYFRNEEVEEFHHEQERAGMNLGWSRGLHDNHARRWQVGWEYEENRFAALPATRNPGALPRDRTRAFPWIGFSSVEDEFRVVNNINGLEVSEDLYLGEAWEVRFGAAGTATGSDESQLYWQGRYENTLRDTPRDLLFVELEAEGFWDQSHDDWENLLVTNRWRWFLDPYDRHQWLLEARFDYARNLTRDRQLLLGGSTGLRGYPSRFQTGDRAFVFTLEKRYHYDIHLWRLFYLASAAFVDVGRAWFPDRDNGENGGVLANAGVGLRINSSRFRTDRVLHIDLAFPIERGDGVDSVQLVLRGRQHF